MCSGTRAQFESNLALLDAVRNYAEDRRRCRHEMLMSYFGEGDGLQDSRCGGHCDNCVRVAAGGGSSADDGGSGDEGGGGSQDGDGGGNGSKRPRKRVRRGGSAGAGAGRGKRGRGAAAPAGFVRASTLLQR